MEINAVVLLHELLEMFVTSSYFTKNLEKIIEKLIYNNLKIMFYNQSKVKYLSINYHKTSRDKYISAF